MALLATLFTASLTAAPPIRLTTDGKQKMDPVFVANGAEIVYAAQVSFSQISLMRLDVAERTIEPFNSGAPTSELCATFSRDEKTRAFIRNNANLHVLLVIQDMESGSTVEHNPGGGFAGVRCISMAPDGSRLLYAFPETEGDQQIFSLSADGKTKMAITKGGGVDGSPRFSPDGRWIAFASTRDGNFDIFTMTSAGEQLYRLTEHQGYDTRPAWSPDGKRLAFTSLRDGNYDIYVVDIDGTNLRRITDHPERDDFSWWHPNGKQLVVVSEREGKQDLYLITL
ncbi:MAG: PD40 domain-containing protein [Planctomycetes bacterium]|nr:PD40 domain-containing protein [Planctomycetota bacterium]